MPTINLVNPVTRNTLIITCLISILLLLLVDISWSFDDTEDGHFGDEESNHSHQHQHAPGQPMPKDKVLLRDVKTLTFQRNKRTTSRRTHSIHQLSCVGGTAGCKLFTPDLVECENVAQDEKKSNNNEKIAWKCRADMSERVQFNHVEVICEGYDYPEDDYILLGSCGLEFTLDYVNPHDYHDNSYFKHMDEHEKELHHERVRSKKISASGQPSQSGGGVISIKDFLSNRMYLLSSLALLFVISILLVRYCSSYNKQQHKSAGAVVGNKSGIQQANTTRANKPVRGYGPLTSAVMATKKAC